MTGVPRLWETRRHPSASRLKASDASSRRWRLGVQGAMLSPGMPRSPTSFFSFFFFSFFFFFFFFIIIFFSSVGLQRIERSPNFIIYFFWTKTASFWPFLFKKNRPKRHHFGACSFLKNIYIYRQKQRHVGPVFPSNPIFWLFSTRHPSQILP